MASKIVIALGGNALQSGNGPATAEAQLEVVRKTCEHIAQISDMGYELAIVHGNGPQVGRILLASETARDVTPAMPFDVCGAMSQGYIGYHLQQGLKHALNLRNRDIPVVTVATQVIVEENDPAFDDPTKPIGPFYTESEARAIVKEKGYEPSIHDFSMTNLETGEDITEEVLSDKNYTFLLVAHRIEEADDSNIDLINEIYDYAVEHGYGFYCLTSSLDDQIEQWKDKTGAEYPFCLMDDITLKTMIRSNPGLMLIKEGTILNKWSDSELPDEYALTDKLENLELGKQKEESDVHTIGYVLLWFAIPLLMVLGVDILVVKRLEKRRKRAAEKAVENSKSSSEA